MKVSVQSGRGPEVLLMRSGICMTSFFSATSNTNFPLKDPQALFRIVDNDALLVFFSLQIFA